MFDVGQLVFKDDINGLWFGLLIYGVGAITLLYYQMRKETPELRRLPQLDGMEEMVRVCSETNRPFLHTIGQSQDWSLIYVICAAQLLKHCAKLGGPLKVRLLVTGMVPAYVTLCSDFIRQGYIEGGHPEMYNPDDAIYMEGLGGYVAGTTSLISRLNCGGLALYGWLHSAAGMILSDMAYRVGALQFSALGGWEQNLGAATADYWVIGPETRQMATYVGGSRTERITLVCEDYIRWAYQALYIIGTALFLVGIWT